MTESSNNEDPYSLEQLHKEAVAEFTGNPTPLPIEAVSEEFLRSINKNQEILRTAIDSIPGASKMSWQEKEKVYETFYQVLFAVVGQTHYSEDGTRIR